MKSNRFLFIYFLFFIVGQQLQLDPLAAAGLVLLGYVKFRLKREGERAGSDSGTDSEVEG